MQLIEFINAELEPFGLTRDQNEHVKDALVNLDIVAPRELERKLHRDNVKDAITRKIVCRVISWAETHFPQAFGPAN